MAPQLDTLKSAIASAHTTLGRRTKETAALRRRLALLTKTLDDPRRLSDLIKNQDNLAGEFQRQDVPELATALKEYITSISAASRHDFERRLPQLCQESDLPLAGNLEEGYRVQGAIEVRAVFAKGVVRVSTVSETVTVSPPTPESTLRAVQVIHRRLFRRPFDASAFARSLVEASLKVGRQGESVPLSEVHRQVFLARQRPDFLRDNSFRRLVSYPLDEFSVDLGRLLQSGPLGIRLELGRDGINVFRENGVFDSYKFLRVEQDRRLGGPTNGGDSTAGRSDSQ